MKCPLFVQVLELKGGLYDSQAMNCLGEECAWWDHAYKVCSLKVIKSALAGISGTLADIEAKIPTELQFRK